MRRLSVLLFALVALAVAAPATGETAAAGETWRVKVDDYFFAPARKTVAKGDVIRFKWVGVKPHDVKFQSVPRGAATPRSCKLKTSGTCKRKVPKAGTYRYICTIHLVSNNMRGRIVVE